MKKVLIATLLAALLFAGSLNQADALYLQGAIKGIESPSYNLKGTTYIPLIRICESHGLDWEWDPIGEVVVLKKDSTEARLKVDSYKIYVNGRIRDLEKPPRFHKNTVVVPLSFAEKTLDKIFNEWSRPEKHKIRSVPQTGRRYTIDTVVIDPGHGGKDPGAIGRYGLKEKDLVLEISKLLKKELEGSGIKVILTRDRDVFIPLGRRASIANENEADFFISVHANAFRSRRIRGFEVYYLSEATDDNARAIAASENSSLEYEDESFYRPTECIDVWGLELDENRRQSKELADSICATTSGKLAVRNRGVKSARFYVLKGACMPAILAEVGFVSNKNDAESLNSPYYRKKLAEAMAGGILSYKREYEKTNGFTE